MKTLGLVLATAVVTTIVNQLFKFTILYIGSKHAEKADSLTE